MFATPKLKLDTFSSAKSGEMTEIGHDVYFNYKMVSKSDQMFQKNFPKWYICRLNSSRSMEWVGKKPNWPQRWYVHIVIDHPRFYHKHYPPSHSQAR
jgi:hypothetical protein